MSTHPEDSLITSSGHILENIVHFARILREAGLSVGPARVVDAVRAVQIAGLEKREDLRTTLRATFISKREHQIVFDAAFEMFWQNPDLLAAVQHQSQQSHSRATETGLPKPAAARIARALLGELTERSAKMRPDMEFDAENTISEKEILRRKDFAQMSASEIAQAKSALRKLEIPTSPVLTRRFERSPRGQRIDVHSTLRHSLATGGEFVRPKLSKRRQISPPIVAICDISGSMNQYSRLFLHFLHALTETRRRRSERVDSFVFGTRLTNISRALSQKDPDEALAACGADVEDWSGGTRIASALRIFNRDWSRRVLGQNAIVMLITDGLERDSDDDLAFEMDRLHRSCRELIWLNPLLRYEQFEPKARGVRTMLPHVDQFRPVHSLNAISDLCESLSDPKNMKREYSPRTWINRAT